MSKGRIFILTFSFTTIATFCVFVYLMTTVNPPPLTDIKKSDFDSSSEYSDEAEYGLDKVNVSQMALKSYAPFYLYNLNNMSTTQKSLRNKSRRVYPPAWPVCPTASPIVETIVFNATDINKSFNRNATNTTLSDIQPLRVPVKGHRRSIDESKTHFQNKIIDSDTGVVNLKIVDENGWPRIEIKFRLNDSLKLNDVIANNSPTLTMHLQKNHDIGDLTQNSEIDILLNDPLIVASNNIHVDKNNISSASAHQNLKQQLGRDDVLNKATSTKAINKTLHNFNDTKYWNTVNNTIWHFRMKNSNPIEGFKDETYYKNHSFRIIKEVANNKIEPLNDVKNGNTITKNVSSKEHREILRNKKHLNYDSEHYIQKTVSNTGNSNIFAKTFLQTLKNSTNEPRNKSRSFNVITAGRKQVESKNVTQETDTFKQVDNNSVAVNKILSKLRPKLH